MCPYRDRDPCPRPQLRFLLAEVPAARHAGREPARRRAGRADRRADLPDRAHLRPRRRDPGAERSDRRPRRGPQGGRRGTGPGRRGPRLAGPAGDRAPGGARRDVLHRAHGDRRRGDHRDRAADPGRPAAQPGQSDRHPHRPGAPSRPAAGRRVRHRVPHHHAGAGGALRDRSEDRRPLPRAPLRLPRHLARLCLAGGRTAAGQGPVRGERDRAAPRQRRLRLRRGAGPVRGHLHGTDAFGGPGDGYAIR
ncbi:hypothetical protein SGPA1_11695 [Streptomyces misionensis JCM 4497]